MLLSLSDPSKLTRGRLTEAALVAGLLLSEEAAVLLTNLATSGFHLSVGDPLSEGQCLREDPILRSRLCSGVTEHLSEEVDGVGSGSKLTSITLVALSHQCVDLLSDLTLLSSHEVARKEEMVDGHLS